MVIFVVVITSLSFGGYFFYEYNKLRSNPTIQSQKDTDDLLAKVAKIYLIPPGEEPTIATVVDPNSLKGQAFFSESQKGDKVLIFSKAGKAVLYRPSINKIIETAPINSNVQSTPTPSTESTSKPLKEKTF